MNPLFQAIFASVFHLTRQCPTCGHKQVVSQSRRRESVACKRCGAQIPPPTDRARGLRSGRDA
jgi:ribosomal protein S27E